MATFEQCQRRYDSMTPDYDDTEYICPDCDAALEFHDDGVRCLECGWSCYPDDERDYEGY